MKCACTELTERKQDGSIVNIASIVGQTGNLAQVNYSASKAGVEALTKSVAKEMGKFVFCPSAFFFRVIIKMFTTNF